MIKLKSSDGKIFEVDHETVKCMEMLNDMVENLGQDPNKEPIPLKEIHSQALDKVLIWCKENKNNLSKVETSINFTKFETKFIQDNEELLFELINVANYLGIKSMLNFLCRSVAMKLKNKSAQEIRDEFGITGK